MQKHVTPEDLESSDELSNPLAQNSAGFGLVDFLRIARVRWKLIVGATIVTVALALAFVIMATPYYTSTAIVMLDQQKNSVESADAVLSDLGSDPATIQNQVQILTSLELANRVVDKLKLDQDPDFMPQRSGWATFLSYLNPFNWFPGDAATQANAQGIDLARDAMIRNLLGHLTVEPIGLSTAMSVTYRSGNPVKAARIANGVANAYVEDQLEAKFEATQKATQWLSGRISDLSRQAEEADAAVQRYKAEHNITTTGGGASIVDQQTSDINAQLVAAKEILAEKQAAYSSLLSLSRSGHAADSAAVMASPMVGQLRSQESDIARQLADLSSKYLPGHPKILDLEAQKANVEAKIAEEMQRVVDSAHNDVSIASAHVGSLQASLNAMEGQGATQNKAAVQLTALQSAATSARSMYEAFLGRLNQTQGQEGISTPDSRIISAAEVSTSPSFPKKGLVMGVSIPAGLILGLILAFAAERLDSGFRTNSQVEEILGLPVLATVPEVEGLRKTGKEAADYIIEKPLSSFAEAIRGVQLGLSLANVDRKPKVIVVTSSVPGEGKTTLAISLARLAARGGLKTIVVDGDLRRPNLAKSFGTHHFENGLVEALLGQIPLDQCLSKDPISDALVLPCLQAPANPADILQSQKMHELITNLSRVVDLVIIDSAPMLPVNDTKILCQLADTVLFVVRWEKTPREAAENARRLLADVHAPVAGVALTRADTDRFRYYNYGYQNYHNYGKYYG